MTKSTHPADLAGAEEARRAKRFVSTIFLGRGKFAKIEAETEELAWKAADRLRALHSNGRTPLVYAILDDGRQILISRKK